MAKKKSDTKGLAGIIKNVPREIDIKGQPHMLAWITPKEGETLQALGGSGELGPMGIPSYNPNEDRAREESRGHAGDTDTSDAETDDPDTAGAGSTETGYRGPDEPGGERMGTPGKDLGSYFGGVGGDNLTPEQFASQILANNVLKGGATSARNTTWFTDIDSPGTDKARGAVKGIIDREIERRKGFAEDNYGIPSLVGSAMGAMGMYNLDNISEKLEDPNSVPAFDDQGKIQGVFSPGPFGLGMVYSGNPIEGYEETGWSDTRGDRDTKTFAKTTPVSVTDAVEATPETPSDYYLRGIGTGTTDMMDAAKRQAYLEGLVGQTTSAIGATYDPTARSYTIPGGSKKQKTRLRGLDIFKPISTVS